MISVPEAYVGTAAWTIPAPYKELFPSEGSHLERYAKVLNSVEINSSFYRDHKAGTYARWAETVPDHFRFAVKVSRELTHDHKLDIKSVATHLISEKLLPIFELGPKLGCLLVQLPPSLQFQSRIASAFFNQIRELYSGSIALEPRHKTWNSDKAQDLLRKFELTQVIADPEPYAGANNLQADAGGFLYYRLHGSPEIYKSNYGSQEIGTYADQMREYLSQKKRVWCIFDNTTFGHATGNAVELLQTFQHSLQPA